MLDVVFIALQFPPVFAAGVVRPLKFIKYFPEFGINPLVVTIGLKESTVLFGESNGSHLLDDIPSSARVVRLQSRQPLRRRFDILRSLAGVPFGLHHCFYDSLRKHLRRIMQEHSPRAIYATLPPFDAAEIALNTRQITGLPIIVDMRDAWSQWSVSPFRTYFHYWSALHRERRLFEQADAIVTVTEQLSSLLKTVHPMVPATKFKEIPNGFDVALKTSAFELTGGKETIRIAHAGRFYYDPEYNIKKSPVDWLAYRELIKKIGSIEAHISFSRSGVISKNCRPRWLSGLSLLALARALTGSGRWQTASDC